MSSMAMLVLTLVQAAVPPESGEAHLRNIRQLTFGGQNAEAYFSGSGRLLIFQRTGPTEQCDQMYVMGTDGNGLRRVSDGRGRTTCGWYFDHDRRIFYASTEGADSTCPPRPDYSQGYVWALYPYDIYTADPDGSHPRRLTHTLGYDGGPVFSPDGKLIAYRAFHPVTAADSAEYLSLLKQHLVRPSRMDIWVMNADGSGQRMVVHVPGPSFAPFFHPDGKRILFASNFKHPEGLDFDLYLVNLDGTGLEQVTGSPEFDAFPMFSPDGKQLVWISGRGRKVPHESNVFLADWVEHP